MCIFTFHNKPDEDSFTGCGFRPIRSRKYANALLVCARANQENLLSYLLLGKKELPRPGESPGKNSTRSINDQEDACAPKIRVRTQTGSEPHSISNILWKHSRE